MGQTGFPLHPWRCTPRVQLYPVHHTGRVHESENMVVSKRWQLHLFVFSVEIDNKTEQNMEKYNI